MLTFTDDARLTKTALETRFGKFDWDIGDPGIFDSGRRGKHRLTVTIGTSRSNARMIIEIVDESDNNRVLVDELWRLDESLDDAMQRVPTALPQNS